MHIEVWYSCKITNKKRIDDMQYFTMTYLPDGRISSKYITSTANIEGSTVTTTKTMTYSYNTKHSPYQVVTTDFSNNTITPVISTATYTWSANGNLTLDAHNHTNTTFSWDEENRLTNYVSSTTCGYYLYDAGGERYYKCSGMFYYFVWNGHGTSYYAYSSPVLYASQYLVVSANEYTKHYYAGNERIASRIGEGRFPALNSHCVANSLLAAKKTAANANLPSTHYASNSFTWFHTLTDNTAAKAPIYWTHGDHLGSTAWATDTAGAGVQHFRYLPFGEPLYSKKTGTFSSRYTFSGKERDSESGLNYFGARYYNSDLSLWISVDPLADKYPNLSPYVYCADNPVRLVDENGREVVNPYTAKVAETKNVISKIKQMMDEGNCDVRLAKGALRTQKRMLREYEKLERNANFAIAALKENGQFDILNNLKDEYGNTIDVYITYNNNLPSTRVIYMLMCCMNATKMGI